MEVDAWVLVKLMCTRPKSRSLLWTLAVTP